MLDPAPALGGFPLVLASALALYLLAGEPVAGTVVYRRLRAAAGDPGALVRFYRLTIATEWALAALAALVVALGAWSAADVGLRWPDGDGLKDVTPALAGLLVGMAGAAVAARRSGALPPGPAVRALVPATRVERRWFAGVAVTAGCCEELLYRGVLIAFATGVLGLDVWLAAALATVVFGLAHVYQGLGGVLLTTLLGALFAAGYVVTASLLVPVIAHALLDLRVLALPLARR